MSLYPAIGLHSRNGVLAIMDGDGKPVLRCRRLHELPRLLADPAPYSDQLVGVAVESTCNGCLLVDGLMGHGKARFQTPVSAVFE